MICEGLTREVAEILMPPAGVQVRVSPYHLSVIMVPILVMDATVRIAVMVQRVHLAGHWPLGGLE